MALISTLNLVKYKTKTDNGLPGIVVNNNDPLKQGRIKVNIPGMFDTGPGDDTSNLPWVSAFVPPGLGSSPNVESLNVPELKSQVWIIFPFGNLNQPFYTSMPKTAKSVTGELAADYPNTYGFVDKLVGFSYKVNRSAGTVSVKIGNVSIRGTSDGIEIDGPLSATHISAGNGFTGTINTISGPVTFVDGICVGDS